MQLDIIVQDKNLEKEVLNNLMKARKITGKTFKVIFWNKALSENKVKEFVKRNKEILFKMSTQITKQFSYSWFIIDSDGDKSRWRYHCDGGILSGIDSYIKIIKHMIKRDTNENRNRW